jgi:hypothetical protein
VVNFRGVIYQKLSIERQNTWVHQDQGLKCNFSQNSFVWLHIIPENIYSFSHRNKYFSKKKKRGITITGGR